MRRLLEGSRAIAETVARCRPQVVPAYPITPQTHIVEGLGALIKDGSVADCAFITVESEFAAMSAAIGASATGARAYTATASQGLLYMTEALFNAAGLGLPIVMTVANRAIGAPINIWNDQSDSMSQRDCGWIQLYAADNQSAIDLHVLAFALAERLSTPVMVCVDGFVLTHAFEPLEVPDQDAVDDFLPAYTPRQVLDPDDPVTIGAMVGPEAFTEVRYLADLQQRRALQLLPELAEGYGERTGRLSSAVAAYRCDDADVAIVVLGSASGTARSLADQLAEEHQGPGGQSHTPRLGVLTLSMFRPFPYDEIREALTGLSRVIVVERALAPGAAGIVSADVRHALIGTGADVRTVVAGLGGRAVRSASLRAIVQQAFEDTLPRLSFLDLNTEVVQREIARMRSAPADAPSTLAVLRDSVRPASGVH